MPSDFVFKFKLVYAYRILDLDANKQVYDQVMCGVALSSVNRMTPRRKTPSSFLRYALKAVIAHILLHIHVLMRESSFSHPFLQKFLIVFVKFPICIKLLHEVSGFIHWPIGSKRRFYDGHDRKVDGSTLTQASLLRLWIRCFTTIISAWWNLTSSKLKKSVAKFKRKTRKQRQPLSESGLGFENRDPGSGNFRDLINFLASRFPGFLTKFPGIFSTVTQSKLQKIFVRSSQALDWFCAKLVNS